ncbi:MAG: S8 family serine peptidase [Candidatus Eisenbacteria bacterium]
MVFLVLLAAAAVGRNPEDPTPPGSASPPPSYRIQWKGAGTMTPASLPEAAAEGRRLASEGNRRLLFQFHTKPDRDRLRRAGFSLLAYLPRDTWIVSVDGGADWAALPPEEIRWVGTIPVKAKIAPAVAEEALGKKAGAIPLRVRFHEDVDLYEGATIISRAGGTPVLGRTVFHGFDANLPVTALDSLAAKDEVLWIGAPLPPPVPANDGIRENGNVDSVHAAPLSILGSGVTAGIWDGGPIAAHSDFGGRLLVVDTGAPTSDHATHVAGTLGGSGARSALFGALPNQWRGVAPDCSMLSYDYYGDIPGEYGSAITAYDVDLTSNSWVLDVDQTAWNNCYFYGDYDGYAPEFDAVVAGYFGKRIPIVVAAGNERNDGDCGIAARSGYACVPPPGTAKNVITVGAVNTNNSSMTTFSGYGPVDDGRVKPDIVAGGCQSNYNYSIWSTWSGDTYGSAYYCGTSMATPAVSGAVALLLETWGAVGSPPWPSTLKALLLGTADDLGNPGPDYRFGYGRMNVKRAADRVRFATVIEDSVSDGGVREWTFPVPAGFPELKVTLVWDDPAGTPLANPALVNDLDLLLLPPTAPPAYPSVLDPSNPAASAVTGVDHLNNVEQVVALSPQEGTWTARVTGGNVPVGTSQTFSLVGIDTRAPDPPDSLEATTVDDTTIGLLWAPPDEADGAGVLLVRSSAAVMWGPDDGETYAAGDPLPGDLVVVDTSGGSTLTDRGLFPGTRYHYAAFAYDRFHNYSPGAASSAATGGGATAVPIGGDVPALFRLHPARPNPFNPITHLRFDLPEPSPVTLEIYSLQGRRVRVLLNETLSAGSYEEIWDGTGPGGEEVASGVYFARLTKGTEVLTQRLTLLR